MNFNDVFKDKVEKINSMLETYLPKAEGPQKVIMEAMQYSMKAGGKRIRPMLMDETFTYLNGQNRALLEPFMAALEMIHTYSLVHDDLPALDNDDYRRGVKTTHVVYGEDMAILAGDALLNFAFETAGQAFDRAKNSAEVMQVAKAMQILTRKPGIYGMIGGQVVDVALAGKPVDKETLGFIYENKTSALVECAMMIGAVLAGADAPVVNVFEQAARRIGLAFQIQDDILDETSTFEVLGKPIHSDEKNEKTTYVVLKGIEASRADVENMSREAMEMVQQVKNGGPDQSCLMALIEKMIYREN